MKQIVTYSKPLKTLLFLFLLLSVVFFHESEKVAHYATGKQANITDQKFVLSGIYYKTILSLANAIESFKSHTGLSSFYSEENRFFAGISESPVLFKKARAIKQNRKSVIENRDTNSKIDPGQVIPENKAQIAFADKKSVSSKIAEKVKRRGFAPPYRFLFVGDSMVQSPLGTDLEKKLMTLKRSFVIKKGVVSSGLLRPDYYDWPKKLNKFIGIYQPKILVVMLGTNDISALYHPKRKRFYAFNSKRMKRYYRQNVRNLMQIVNNYNLKAFWIGLPATEKDEVNEKLKVINSIHKDVARGFKNIYYIKTWDLFRNEDESVKKYIIAEGRKKKIRSSDGVHYTEIGGAYAGKHIFKKIKETIKRNPKIPERIYADSVKRSYYSTIFGKKLFLQAYIPRTEKKEYPVICLFGGVKKNRVSFFNKHEKYLRWLSQVFQAIIVTPHSSPQWSIKATDRSNKSFVKELIPTIRKKLPWDGKISAMGINEGGGGAIKVALENPDLFVSVSAINGSFLTGSKSLGKNITIEEDIAIPFKTRVLISSRDGSVNSGKFREKATRLLKEKSIGVIGFNNNKHKLYRYLIVELKKHIRYHRASIDYRALKMDEKDSNGYTQLFRSIKYNHTDITKDLIMGNADVNTQSLNGLTPLMIASKFNRYKTAAILIDNNAKIDDRDNLGNSSLIHAATKGNNKIISLLVKKGADVNRRNNEGSTPVMLASRFGLYKTVKLLKESGAFLNIANNDKSTPLMEAVKNNRIKTAKYLLANGAKINEKDLLGWAALMKSALNGYEEMTRVLIKSGAHVRIRDQQNRTPLMAAAWKGKQKIVKILLRYGAKINSKDNNGETALIKAVKYNKKSVVKYILSQKADINQADLSSATPLIHCAKSGLYHMAKILINRGANIEKPDLEGRTPLHMAAMKGHVRVVSLLLKRGADVKAVSVSGKSPLIYATNEAHHNIVKLLIDYGSDTDLKDIEGNSSLHYAISNNLGKIAEMLIVKGAIPGDKDLKELLGLIKKSDNRKLSSLFETMRIVRDGDLLFKKGLFKDAVAKYETAISLEKKQKRDSVIPEIISCKARCHYEMKDYVKTLELYKMAMKYTDQKELIATNFNNMGRTYYTDKKYSSAVNYLTGSLMLYEEINHNEKGFVSKVDSNDLYIISLKTGTDKKPLLNKLYSKRVKFEKNSKLKEMISWDGLAKMRREMKDGQIVFIYSDSQNFNLQLLLTSGNIFIRNSKKIFVKADRNRYLTYSRTFLGKHTFVRNRRNTGITLKKSDIYRRRFNKLFNINYDIKVDPKMEKSRDSKTIGKLFFDYHKG